VRTSPTGSCSPASRRAARRSRSGSLLGLNLAVSGSLPACLWFKAARAAGAEPSALRFTRIGAPMALAAMLAGLATVALIGPA
jgi:Na+/H+ antiporter NhaD/arsenite permease-like protein